MSAESIEKSSELKNNSGQLHKNIGSLAVPQQVRANTIPPVKLLQALPEALHDVDVSNAKIRDAATSIKEKFALLSKAMQADERDDLRAELRRDSVRQVFTTMQMLTDHNMPAASFAAMYRQAETAASTVDKGRLTDLIDVHESHPAIRVYDDLQTTPSIPKDDIVFMRRTTLLLMDEHID